MSIWCVRMIFYLGKALMHRESCRSFVRLCLPIIFESVSGISQFIVKILRIDTTLMGYCIAGQVRTMMRSIMCKSNLSMV